MCSTYLPRLVRLSTLARAFRSFFFHQPRHHCDDRGYPSCRIPLLLLFLVRFPAIGMYHTYVVDFFL